jgi:hypothetical protein
MAALLRPPLAAGLELVVEVEANRRRVRGHASLLRFRVANNLDAACRVEILVRLRGQGVSVDQAEGEVRQCCQFDRRGDRHIFSFPFRGLMAGEIAVRQLQVSITWPGRPGEETRFELPDQSLSVQVSDPAQQSGSPAIVVSGGIKIESYGSDVRNVLNANAARESETVQAATEWEPISLRLVREFTPLPAAEENVVSAPKGILPVRRQDAAIELWERKRDFIRCELATAAGEQRFALTLSLEEAERMIEKLS